MKPHRRITEAVHLQFLLHYVRHYVDKLIRKIIN